MSCDLTVQYGNNGDADMLPYMVALGQLDLSPKRKTELLKYFGGPGALWRAPDTVVRGFDTDLAERLSKLRASTTPEAEMERLAGAGCQALLPGDDGYPVNLKEIYDPPMPLYVKGILSMRDQKSVAIVGSRRPTQQGKEIAVRLAYGLAEQGITIISGLARGIDTAAHRGALKAGGRTLAVLGSGLDNIYPPENCRLADKIAENGALLSEFCLRSIPAAWHFPQRNRIISGLALAVIVVEAGDKSGALITAYMALEQGRDVMAVPGSIDNPMSRGPHKLIRQGALLVETVDDIIEALGMQLCLFDSCEKETLETLTESQAALLKFIDYKPRFTEEIIMLADGSAAMIGSDLTLLELKGYIKQLSGGAYIRA
ncbi:MAG: DNA-processing protein DprA [bacterium]|jgi:DNA processing protein|nr:DNA-processing protein DprA [bacterium]MDD3804629.1 DNA-processing protein DprA [bacterium]MDD4557378.1 DNA-processing protein DprA [bacterium]